MEIGRIEIQDVNGHVIAWYTHGVWQGMTTIIPSAIHLMVKSLSKPKQAFNNAVKQLPIQHD